MYQLVFTNKFKKDVKFLKKRGYEMDLLKNAIIKLEESGNLLDKNKPHKLVGEYSGYWEGHLKPDWLLIWKTFMDDNEIWLTRTGTHADLF